MPVDPKKVLWWPVCMASGRLEQVQGDSEEWMQSVLQYLIKVAALIIGIVTCLDRNILILILI